MGLIQTFVPRVAKPPIETPLNWEAIPHAEYLEGFWMPRASGGVVPNLANPGNGDMFPSDPAPAINPARGIASSEQLFAGETRTGGTLQYWKSPSFTPRRTGSIPYSIVATGMPITPLSSAIGIFGLTADMVLYSWYFNKMSFFAGGIQGNTAQELDSQWRTYGVSHTRAGGNDVTLYLDGVKDGEGSRVDHVVSAPVVLGHRNGTEGWGPSAQQVGYGLFYAGIALTPEEHALFADPAYFYRTFFQPQIRHIPVGSVSTPEPGVTVTLQRPGGGSPDFTEEELRQFNIGMWAVIEGASWVAQLPDPLPEQVMLDIIDGLQDWSSPENDAQFEKTRQLMRDDPTHGGLRVVSDTLIFDLPPTPDYDIQTNGSLQFVVPSSAYERRVKPRECVLCSDI
jgi:hypothetical protein